jgi:hypothetical protein
MTQKCHHKVQNLLISSKNPCGDQVKDQFQSIFVRNIGFLAKYSRFKPFSSCIWVSKWKSRPPHICNVALDEILVFGQSVAKIKYFKIFSKFGQTGSEEGRK